MKYELLGISLMLTALLALWTLLAFVSRLIWRIGRQRIAQWSPQARARLLSALQVGPLLGAVGGVLGSLLPAYLLHEPPATEEPYSVSLLLPTALCLALWLRAGYRMLLAWRSTRRLLQGWQKEREPVAAADIAAPVWRIPHPLPLIAVVGVWRPQMFVAGHLWERLSPDELAAVFRHEQWHLTARDNFWRVLADFCRLLPGGRDLEREWYESVELTADAAAARHSQQSALDLASALVKIARLFPAGGSVTMPATVSTVLLEESRLARRVQCLLEHSRTQPQRASVWLFGAMFGLFVMTIWWTALQSDALRVVHHGLELLVAYLP